MTKEQKFLLLIVLIVAGAGSVIYVQNEKKEHMMGMMHECAKSHKDGKMCQHEMMEKCESEMTKDECAKMMKEMKNKHKPMIKK